MLENHRDDRLKGLHSNTDLAPNVVVSSDTTAAPFGPEPGNGRQAVLDPTNPNTLLVAYNDYTPNGHGSRYTVGYSISSDNGANWSQAIHGLLKMDGGLYDGAGDPGVAFDEKKIMDEVENERNPY